jgi:hypothetical protein
MGKHGKILLGAVGAVALVVGGLHFYANQRMRELVDARLEALVESGQYEKLSYESLSVGLGGTFTMRNLLVVDNGKSLVVQNVRVSDFDPLHETPWSLDLQLQGLQFPDGADASFLTDLTPLPRAVLMDLVQNDTLPLALHYRYDYEPEERERIESNLDLSLPQSFAFTTHSTTLGIPLAALTDSAQNSNDPMAAMTNLTTLMSQGEMPTATFTLTDQGLLDTLVTRGAADSGTSPEQYRAYLLERVNTFPQMLPPSAQSAARAASAEVASFLGGNSTLQVRLNPEFGGSFAQLQPQIMGAMFSGELNKIVDLLHFEVENRKP